MNQAIHIFRKDLRHFWKEIFLSWCLLGLFVWRCVPTTLDGDFARLGFIQLSRELVGFLLFLSWWVLLVRLVQDESLVGDRQFWVTRPYRWTALLPEKIAFALLFVSIPLLLAQAAILHLNGFSVFPHWDGLLHLQGLALTLFVLPAFLLSIVTETFVQVILAAFAALLCFLFKSALESLVPDSSMPHATGWLDSASGLLIVVAIIAVVLLQYGWRRTFLSRNVIISVVVLLTIFALITPYESLIAKEFPRLSQPAQPLKVDVDSTVTEIPLRAPRRSNPPEKIAVAIPVLATAEDPQDIIFVEGQRIRLDAPVRWQSNWQRQWIAIVTPNMPQYVTFDLPRYIFDSVSSTPAKIDIESALSIYRRKDSWKLIAQADDFRAPQLGICTGVEVATEGLTCRAPISGASLLIGTLKSSESTCPQNAKPEQSTRDLSGYYSNVAGTSSALMNPIVDQMISFPLVTVRWSQENWKLQPRICAGTPIDFSSLALVRRQSTVNSLQNIRLADYRLKPASDTGFGAVAIGESLAF